MILGNMGRKVLDSEDGFRMHTEVGEEGTMTVGGKENSRQ